MYLGLVLAGATPQVLAQAATAKQFNLKDEIELKDSIDEKPDPTTDELVASYETYFRDVKEFVSDLAKLYSIEKFTPRFDTFDSTKDSFEPCPPTGTLVSNEKKSHIDRWILPAIEQAGLATQEGFWLSDCINNSGPDKRNVRASGIELTYDKIHLTYKASFVKSSPQRANSLYEQLSRALEVFEVDQDDAFMKVLFPNTSLAKANNQVFIVTRLPRAGLDSLLASDAK